MLESPNSSMHIHTPLVIISLLIFFVCVPASAAIIEDTYLITSSQFSLEFTPLKEEIIPDYNDGVIVVDMENPWTFLIYWKDILPLSALSHFGLLTDNSNFADHIRTFFLPAFAIFISLPFFIIFSRRLNPEEEENSTPARILRYLRCHPASPMQRIVDAVGVSRGSVSYQIMRLEKEGKIVSQEIQGRRYYSAMQSGITPLSAELFRILSHKRTREIFLSLLKKPNQTISLIAEDISRTPNAVGYQMKKISNAILVKTEEKRNTSYSLQPEAVHLYHSLFPNA